MVSAVSPGWISVTPKLTVIDLPSILGCGTAQGDANLVGPAAGGGVVAVGQEHNELLTAVAGHEIARTAGALEQRGEALDRFVARLVAEVSLTVLKRSRSHIRASRGPAAAGGR